MKLPPSLRAVVAMLVLTGPALAAISPPIPLWPAKAPGETKELPPEADTSKSADKLIAGRPLIRLGNVSTPTMTVYSPAPAKNTGAAVLVCPGGGYNILAYDLEGTEVCEWLNSIGVTGILLKYRVPARAGRQRQDAPLEDAQRAISLARQNAEQWGIKRLGILGFSAGGHLAAVASNSDRNYSALDEADKQSVRPDFCVLIYPAYLTLKDKADALAPELPVNAKAPPTFIAMTQDDPVRVESALAYSHALKNAKVPCELHIYPTGGHGYGLRRTEQVVTTWPDRVADWMGANGWLKK